jgi:DNA (cytosine-5)-methyltransferase 1
MKYISVCSGIEAATTAWHHLNWKPLAFSEIEPFPSAVLAHHWPTIPNLGNMTKHHEWNITDTVDLLVGGTPCQSFSVAGLRKGLTDPRGGLMLTYLEIAQRLRPRWIVWENVPGVLSSNGGRDFGSFLGALGELGYGWAYRVLDAQWFGVAQRRRRVFVVGCLGDAASAAKVLFESESVRRDSPPGRKARQVAPTLPSRSTAGGGLGTEFDCGGGLIPQAFEVANCLTARMHRGINSTVDEGQTPIICQGKPLSNGWKRVSFAADCGGYDEESGELGDTCSICGLDYGNECECPGPTQDGMEYQEFNGVLYARHLPVAIQAGAIKENPNIGPDGIGVRTDGVAYTLEARSEVQAVCFDTTQVTSPSNYSNPKPGDPCRPPPAGAHPPAVAFRVHGEHSTAMTGKGNAHVASPVETSRCLDTCGGYSSNQGGNVVLETHQIASQVRRLTPTECERLQGFPDDHTLIPWRNKPADQCPDGPRYKALGNSMAVPVMRWIGERIHKAHQDYLLNIL